MNNADPSNRKNDEINVPVPSLNLFDCVSIMVGLVLGVGLYETAPLIAAGVGSIEGVVGIWVLGGVLSLCGAICYAELIGIYPKRGGDYHFLQHAYSPILGFLFVWARTLIVQPASIAAMTYPFANNFIIFMNYFNATTLSVTNTIYICILTIGFLTALNLIKLNRSKWFHNLLTVIKVLSIAAFCLLAFSSASPSGLSDTASIPGHASIGLSIILVLFTFGGWNEIAFVAADVKNPKQNVVRALFISIFLLTLIYLLANLGFVKVLGFESMINSSAIAADTLETILPGYGGVLAAALISLSVLGATNAMIITGARVTAALGDSYSKAKFLSPSMQQHQSPVMALIIQAALASLIILLSGSFGNVVVFASTVVWIFFLLSGISVFILRAKLPEVARPYCAKFHPFTTIIFCLSCIYLIWSSINYDLVGSLISICILLSGLPVYYWLASNK